MFSSAIISLALAASALANVYLTSPVASTSWPAGQEATVTWQDDGMSPSLDQWGNASFAIYVGNSVQQTPLQTIAASVNVLALSSFTFTPDATIGPNSGEYFIRVTSLSYKNPSTPQYYQEAFSALFTLTGMTGTFNSTIQAEINGQSTAPIGGTATSATATAASTAQASGSASTTGSTTSTGTSGTSSAPSTTSTTGSSANGASGKPLLTTGFVAVVAALVGASFL